jgi:FkbM family methyltransferase
MREGLKLYYQVGGLPCLLQGVVGTLVGSRKTMSVRLPESKGKVWLRMPSTDVTTYRQVLLHEEYKFDFRRPPQTIIDAGANVGLASVYFASTFPDARIIAIEPEEQNFELLKRNVAGFPNVTPVHGALWNEDTEISVIDPGLGESGYVTDGNESDAAKDYENRGRVRAYSMDSLIEKFDLETIDILKVDIEGAELEVFEHAKTWIDKVDAVVIELHERIKPGCEQAFLQATEDFGEPWDVGENTFRVRPRACVRGQRLEQ